MGGSAPVGVRAPKHKEITFFLCTQIVLFAGKGSKQGLIPTGIVIVQATVG